MADPRTVKPKLPARVIITAVAIGVAVFLFVIIAVLQSGRGLAEARMSGKIIKKEFNPAPEEQIVLSRDGKVNARHKDGDFILTVEVPQKDGTKKIFNVWLDKARYDAVNVGDTYDVGPALVRGE
jgi:hypothetical protein